MRPDATGSYDQMGEGKADSKSDLGGAPLSGMGWTNSSLAPFP